jgi:hypothetical protein
VIGLIRAGQQLSDPYGSDNVDLPVRNFVLSVLKASKKILNTPVDTVHANEATEAAVSELRKTARPSKTLRERILRGVMMTKGATSLVNKINDSTKKAGVKVKKRAGPDDACYHCRGTGHWKKDCPFGHLVPEEAQHCWLEDLTGNMNT